MTLDQVNYLNAGLMMLSCALAYVMPLELFLGAYAILGPLHYLTQISWLHDRKYFAPNRLEVGLLWTAGILASLGVFASYGEWPRRLINSLPFRFQPSEAIFIVLGAAFALAVIRSWRVRVVWILGVAIFAHYTAHSRWVFLWVGSLLPTIIHVYAFTFLFVLLGSLKTRSRSGMLSLGVMVLCSVFFFISPESRPVPLTDYALAHPSFAETLAMDLRATFGLREDGALRFIAFAYTYHYLNWFSKTGVIRWHEISRKRAFFVVMLYAASVAAYAVDYQFGLQALFYFRVPAQFQICGEYRERVKSTFAREPRPVIRVQWEVRLSSNP